MFKKIVAVVLASFLLAIGINGFIIPNRVIDGGMIGIGLIFKYALGVRPGLAILVLSLPIYTFMYMREKRLFYNSIHGLLLSSFFIDVLAPIQDAIHLPTLFSVAIGGTLIGLGAGIMLRHDVSTGGLDLLALAISEHISINVGLLIFLVDGIILYIGYVIVGIPPLLSALAVFFIGLSTTLVTVRAKIAI